MTPEPSSKIADNQLSSATGQPEAATPPGVNWTQVGFYLALAFGSAWLIDLVMYIAGGLTQPAGKVLLQFQMLTPAFSAMLLGVFFFKNSPIYYRTNHGPSRWFIYYFFLLTLLYLIGSVISLVQPEMALTLSNLLLIPNFIGLILLVVLRLVGGKQTFTAVGMGGGMVRYWLLFGLGLTAFWGLQALLNLAFGLGTRVDLNKLFIGNSAPTSLLMFSMVLNTLIIGPILGLIISFGEEYGWRGYLQGELVHLGRVRGVLILGIIWGIWHWPVIWMGYNYPGQPLLGSLLMVAFTIELAFFLAYAVFKSKGVWTAAYLHALSNQAGAFFFMFLVAPASVITSFGMGIPTLALGAVIILLILRDPLWKESGSGLRRLEPAAAATD